MGKRLVPLIAPAAAIVAAGCAPALQVREPAVSVAPRFEAQPGTMALSPASLDRWWLLFRDPQLDRLIDQALVTGADSRLALARLQEARAIRRAALSRFRLQGDLQANGNVQRTDVIAGDDAGAAGGAGTDAGQSGGVASGGGGDSQSLSLNFALSWEVDLFGRRAATRRAADADLAAARFLFEGSRAALAADVADAFFAARGLTVQLEDASETIRIQSELRRILRIRAQRGLAPDAEVARVDADLAEAQAQVEQLQAELIATKRALLVLTGDTTSSTRLLPISSSLPEAPVPPATLPGDLLQRRPDVREAEARFRSALARTELQRLELFPKLTLQPGVGLTATSGPIDSTVVTWTLGAGLVQPILDRRRLLAELDAQTARAEQAAVTYERTVQVAFSEADQALVRLQADRRRIQLLAAGERRARVAYDAARILFQRGLNDLRALLDAERAWRATRQSLSSARVEALREAVTSFRALGGGWGATNMQGTTE